MAERVGFAAALALITKEVVENIDSQQSQLPQGSNPRVNTPYRSHQNLSCHECSGQVLIASCAHAVDLSLWHDVHGLGIPYLSVMLGETTRNV